MDLEKRTGTKEAQHAAAMTSKPIAPTTEQEETSIPTVRNLSNPK